MKLSLSKRLEARRKATSPTL
jgi:hypothetical protein